MGTPETTVIVLPNRMEVLVSRWPDGTTEADWREDAGDVWKPCDARVFAGSVVTA